MALIDGTVSHGDTKTVIEPDPYLFQLQIVDIASSTFNNSTPQDTEGERTAWCSWVRLVLECYEGTRALISPETLLCSHNMLHAWNQENALVYSYWSFNYELDWLVWIPVADPVGLSMSSVLDCGTASGSLSMTKPDPRSTRPL
jgi:hypothetical protein